MMSHDLHLSPCKLSVLPEAVAPVRRMPEGQPGNPGETPVQAPAVEIQRRAHLHLAEGYVARAYLVEPTDFYARTRGKADVAEARQLVMYLAHVEIGFSLGEVAARYRRDRSTAAYACREVEDRREDPWFDGLVSHIEELVSLRRDPFLQGGRRNLPGGSEQGCRKTILRGASRPGATN